MPLKPPNAIFGFTGPPYAPRHGSFNFTSLTVVGELKEQSLPLIKKHPYLGRSARFIAVSDLFSKDYTRVFRGQLRDIQGIKVKGLEKYKNCS